MVGLVGVVRRAQRTDNISSGHLPFAAPSSLFLSASRILPFAHSTAPFDCGCAIEANLICRSGPSHISLKLLAIVSDEFFRHSETANDVLPHKFLYSCRSDRTKRFGFDPTREVFNCYNCKLVPISCHRERANDVQPPSGVRPNWCDRLQLVLGCCLASAKPLAAFAFLGLLHTNFRTVGQYTLWQNTLEATVLAA